VQERPVSLTIIAWFLIVTSALGVLGMLMIQNNPIAEQMYAKSPLPISAHIAIGIVGALITIACGYGLLKGLNWSRLLYVGWSIIGFAIAMLTMPVTPFIWLSVAFFAIICFFLFRPAANAWFNPTKELEEKFR